MSASWDLYTLNQTVACIKTYFIFELFLAQLSSSICSLVYFTGEPSIKIIRNEQSLV